MQQNSMTDWLGYGFDIGKLQQNFFPSSSSMVENKDSLEPWVTPEQALEVCNHNFDVGADGVIFAMPGLNDTDYSMRIFNSDGSEPEVFPQ
ncbi:hypothetical protein KSP39_PZI014507 [Platanthera zijinensis]|uniref:Uncharacterized protein n=1 Tax=Platanthera zijinensis TaxID=2320716 RepID=A0AAP0G297_9ASPA